LLQNLTPTRAHARAHARTRARTHARTHARMHARTHTRMCVMCVVSVTVFVPLCGCVRARASACVHVCMHACGCTYIAIASEIISLRACCFFPASFPLLPFLPHSLAHVRARPLSHAQTYRTLATRAHSQTHTHTHTHTHIHTQMCECAAPDAMRKLGFPIEESRATEELSPFPTPACSYMAEVGSRAGGTETE